MKQVLAIFRFLHDCACRGERAVLVTLTDVTGSAARAPGEHMAVAENGAAVGSFSGGCVEAAVIAEAQQTLAEGRARHVRYGAGSRYIDLRLPCGGGVDLLFTPTPDLREIECAIALLERRSPVTLRLTMDGRLSVAASDDADHTTWRDAEFVARHDPVLRLIVLGHGAEPGALRDIARVYGADLLLLSPQASLVTETKEQGIAAGLLRFTGRTDALSVDRWTGVVTLFHDHDWETKLLLQALEQCPFFIGAMGSRRTHAERLGRLIAAGADPHDVDRIVGPVGLIPATRDPRTLALSIMAQVVAAYEATIRRDRKTAAGTMNDPHGFVEQHAGSTRPGPTLQPRHIIDLDQAVVTDAWFGRKEDEAHVRII